MNKEQTAATYISKAMNLLETSCSLYEFCDNCLLRNIETGSCMKEEIRTLLTINTQNPHKYPV